MLPALSSLLKTKLQAVQNSAMRVIFRRSKLEHTSTAELCAMSGLDLVEKRMNDLNSKYFKRAVTNNNELIANLYGGYRKDIVGAIGGKKTFLCGHVEVFEPLWRFEIN